tara:strand:+ start:16717 stop:17922 length:1206 start_codon:yes stop_codon:yes gene_type:complete
LSRFLILSNGHGEDLSGSLLARRLMILGNKVDAFPIVGNGNEYKKAKINIIGNTRNFNTGGLGYNSLKGRFNDLFNGQIIYLFKKLFLIFLIRRKYDYFLVVGDIVPIFFSWISRKKYFTYLVAYSSHYEGKLNLPWPCKHFLTRSHSIRIYSRDLFTSYDLKNQLNKEVIFLGNPFMDNLSILNKKGNNTFYIALLPGSRFEELLNNTLMMLELLERLASYEYFGRIKFNFAMVPDCKIDTIQAILEKRNWQCVQRLISANEIIYCYKFIQVNFSWNAFEEILNKSHLAISMSGTAAEQMVGLGKPVVQIEGEGPQFTKLFADAQRRLLGEYVFCHTKYLNKDEQIDGTIDLLLSVMYSIKLDNSFLKNCKQVAKQRIGDRGATIKIADDIQKHIRSNGK